jgi:murein DD-endopeptidase MepM/ murein hydrolase activator NlpD
MMQIRNGYAVGGKPGESAMAQAEANRNFGADRSSTGPASDNGFRSSPVGGAGGAGSIGNGGINKSTTSNELRSAVFDPDKANARLGPNAAQAMAAAGVDPDRAIVAAKNINFSGVPASGNMLQSKASIMDRSLQNVLDYSPQPTVQQQTTMPSYPGLNNLVMGNTMGSPYNNVIQYGMPVTGTVRGLPGAARNPLDPNAPMRYHSGVDIATVPGAEVVSMVPGKVAQFGTAGGYGSFVDVMNYDGTMTRYATHQAIDPSLQTGDTVLKGQTLGTAGPLPKSNFSHLHMEQMTPADKAFQEVAAAYRAGATTEPVKPGKMVGRTSNYNKEQSLTSTQQLLDRLGLQTGSQMTMNPNTPATALAAGPQSIINSGYYDPTPASAFPEFDRLDTVPNYSALGNSIMGETLGSPYNNITQSFAEQNPASDFEHMAAGFGADTFRGTPAAPAQVAQNSVNLPRPRPDSLAQIAQAPVALPRPRPANLTQFAQAPVALPVPRPANLAAVQQALTLPRPRPANLSPLDQALQVASNVNNFKPFVDNIGIAKRGDKDDRRNRKGKDGQNSKKVILSEDDKKSLISKGYTEKQIENMTQEEINAILIPENVAGVVPPVTPTTPPAASEGTATAARGGRMGYAQGGTNREDRAANRSDNKETSSSKKPAASTDYEKISLPDLPAWQPYQMPTYNFPAASPLVSNFMGSLSQPIPAVQMPQYQSMVSPLQNTQASFANPAMGTSSSGPSDGVGFGFGVNAMRYNPMLMDERPDYALTENDSLSNALRLLRG